ncbi:MAG: aromatic acid exporter family protein [Lachnospiraceae bacterium]|nr:aromatic acid exporter family protein [Lachnospiraceae bacterium]
MKIVMDQHHGKWPFPLIGHRILKTAFAVFICLLIHIARGYRGGVAESCITAIICMQPYAKKVRKSAGDRITGTIMGGFWGLAFLLLVTWLPGTENHMLLVYVMMSLGVILAVYTCVLLNIADAAALSAIVFLCLVLKFPEADPSLPETLLRIMDTVIGALVATAVNTFRIPTRKRLDRVFFLQLNHLAADRYSRISSRVLTELNRLYDSGCRICLETPYAPAFLISQLQTLHINMPVIVLGGAALYDIRENVYREVQEIPHEDVDYLVEMIEMLGLCGVIFTIRGRTMMLFHVGEMNQQEIEDYRMMRRSPYRNYLPGSYSSEDQILAVRMILDEAQAQVFELWLMGNITIAERFHVVRIPRPKHPGETLFYFYKRGVSIEACQKHLLDYEKKEEGEVLNPVIIQPISARYDPERDAVHLLNRIKAMFQKPLWIRDRKEKANNQ